MTHKKPEEGACPKCRKLIPLVTRRGDLVLQTHHVVVADPNYHGHDVAECDGSGGEPAVLDDSEDWGWVPEPEEEPGKQPAGPVAVDQAIRDVTRQAAVRQSMTASAVPPELRPTRVELNGIDISSAVSSVEISEEAPRRIAELADAFMEVTFDTAPPSAETELLAGILAAVRQAYIDVTGAPPGDGTAVAFDDHDVWGDAQTLGLRLPVDGEEALTVAIPLDPAAARDSVLRAATAREAADVVRRQLRERRGGRCEAGNGPCVCGAHGRQGEHICRTCGARWTGEPGTPSYRPLRPRGLPCP